MTEDAFVRDDPADLAELDAFAHGSYARVLAATLASAPAPFTIGLFGPWGVGKSTVIRGVANQLPADCAFVEVDVWRFEGDALRRELLRTLEAELRDDLAKPVDLEDLSVDVSEPELRFAVERARLWQLAALTISVAAVALAAIQLNAVQRALTIGDKADASMLTLVTALALFLLGLVRAATEPVARQRTTKRIEDADRFAAKFRELLQNLRPRRRRLVIAIDNLDRSTAARAVETLSTIKTFLEPVAREGGTADLAVLIAVDDMALRSHLADEPDADEYLRKFFNATIRVQQVVPDDARAYTADALAPFAQRRQVPEDQFARLVALVHAALRHSPRRIKQFVNNLELRLRVMEDREGADPPLIAERLSANLPMVAKMAILEEEWPTYYEAILERPSRLAEDTAQALAREGGDTGTDLRLADFLVVTSDIISPQLAAYVHLKQSDRERRTPGLAAFREAAASGAVRAAVEMLEADPEHAPAYLADLPDLFARELRTGSLPNARTVLEVGLSAPQRTPDVRRLVDAATRDPRFAGRELLNLRAGLLDAAYDVASEAVRERLVSRLLDRLPTEPEPHARATAARFFAQHAGDLAVEQRERLRDVLAGPTLSEDLEVLEAFAEAEPRMLPPLTLVLVSNLIGRDGSSLSGEAGDRLVTIARGALDANPDTELHNRVVGAVGGHLGGDGAGPPLDAVVDIIAFAEAASPEVTGRVIAAIAGRAAELDTVNRAALLRLAARSPEALAALGLAVARHDVDELRTWVAAATVTEEARRELANALLANVASIPTPLAKVVELAELLVGELTQDELAQLLLASPVGTLRALLSDWPGARPAAGALVEPLLARATAEHGDARTELIGLFRPILAEVRDRIAGAATMVDDLPSADDETVSRRLDVLAALGLEALAVSALLESLERRPRPVVERVAAQLPQASLEARRGTARALAARYARHPADREWLLPILRSEALTGHRSEMRSLLAGAGQETDIFSP